MDENAPVDWIALNLLPGLGPISMGRALERYGSPGAVAYRVPPGELAALPNIARQAASKIRDARRTLRKRAEREWGLVQKHGFSLLTPDREHYPAALREIPDAPPVLYVHGALPSGILRVAVVGSRSPTNYGRKVALGLSSGLAARGIEVVSGGALGIDAHAHQGAMEEDGRTVAVLGSGLLRPYPETHIDLFRRIVAGGGAVISELPLEHPPRAEHFPRRNRLISGLAVALVVVEAALRSGSLSTAHHALEQGREVLAVPGPVSSPRSVGCHQLIQQGAKLIQNIEDILPELPPLYRATLENDGRLVHAERQPALDDLSSDEQELLSLLDEVDPIQLDDLADRAPFGIGRLQAALFGLEVRGAVEQSPGRYYLLRSRRG